MANSEWSKLHPDLLNEIVKYIDLLKDYVITRAICKMWNSALPKIPKHIRGGPWLVLPFEEEEEEEEEEKEKEKEKEKEEEEEEEEDTCEGATEAQHLSVPHLRMPELKNTMVRGSCFGWLISVGIDGTLQASNPFTKAHFNLPPLSTFPGVLSYQPHEQDQEYVLKCPRDGDTYTVKSFRMQNVFLKKIIFSCSPDNDTEFMAVAIYGEFCRLAFYRFGDDKWTDISTTKVCCCFEDILCHEGKMYALDYEANLYEFDMKTMLGGMSTVPLPPDLSIITDDRNRIYLAINPDGDLLLAVRHFDVYPQHKVWNGKEVKKCYKTSRCDLYKLNKSANQWYKEFSLGDNVLVVGFNSSICMPPFSDNEGNCRRNCIYISDNMLHYQYDRVIGGHDVVIFNLENRKVNHLFPNSDFLCPPPIWVTHP